VITLYSWRASAPGAAGGGVTDAEDSARAAAAAWMREHRTDNAVVDQVQLILDGCGLLTAYERTGLTWTGRRRGNHRITWTARRS